MEVQDNKFFMFLELKKHLPESRDRFYCSSNTALVDFLLFYLSFINAEINAPANKAAADPNTIKLIVSVLLILNI